MSEDRAFRSNCEKADTLYIIFFILPPSPLFHLSTLLSGVFLRSATYFLKQAAFTLFLNFFRALFVIKSESYPCSRWHLLKLCDRPPHLVHGSRCHLFVVQLGPRERNRLLESLSHELLRFELLRPRLSFWFFRFLFFFDGVFGFSAITAPVSVTSGGSEAFGTSSLLRVTP